MPQSEQQFLNDLDRQLWTVADRLRSNLDAVVYKHAALGLIFLKYVSDFFHNWQTGKGYKDELGFCKSVDLKKIGKYDYILTPGRYVGAAEVEGYSESFPEKMARLTGQLREQFAESAKLEKQIKKNLAGLGWKI